MARILAFDYGIKRTGLAVTDPLQIIASPLETVATAHLWDFLHDYMQKEEVEAFVVGYPLKADGSPTDSTAAIDAFIRELKKRYPSVQVHLVDEYGSSKDAVRAMIAGGTKQKYRRRKENIDRMAATLLLQEFLQQRL
ncbi:MAG: putative pre-16S rRNA nuclease [Thermonema sp.]|uniref:Holliday junction resolvase RuvX n=1 Tax=Thermonema sp. TaxID=2231181 RepID=UPI0021DE7508|nr:Holliday junction resolvase RuvX [Thermonema sp.]GIV39419.1 MAG: putative pre-16S rRNA nuclease [Thermonema sp.]